MADRLSALSAREPTAQGKPNVNAAKRTNQIRVANFLVFAKGDTLL